MATAPDPNDVPRAKIIAQVVARMVVVMTPPLLLANLLFAAPKGPKPPPPAKKPPVLVKKDAGAPVDPDAAKETGPKESALKTGDAGNKGDPSDNLVKESERKEGDASVKVFEFGQTEIEGRARWPAVTYFVRRMRAEFEAQKLPHRPFMPELGASKSDPAVK